MTLSELLDQLRDRGIVLACEGDELLVRSMERALDPPLLEALRANKPALRELVRSGGYAAATAAPPPAPLLELTDAETRAVVATVPGGADNVQDVYPLAPLQEGILFQHLMAMEGDPYLSPILFRFDSREGLDRYLGALQAVVDRHDILRTAVIWEGVPEPVQVVWRTAPLEAEEVELDPAGGDAAEQLRARFDPRHHRIDLGQAPMLRAHVARDGADGRWLLLLLRHHLVSDHTTLDVLWSEIDAHLDGRQAQLPRALPFRTFVAQARLGAGRDEHRAFFTEMLGDVDEPTAPFGVLDVRGDGAGMREARRVVEPALAARVRERARALGVSAASVFHVAWAQVLARASGRDDVVFGTLLFGRMDGGEGSDRVMGPFINTLPLRVRLGRVGAEASVRQTHALLAELLRHEHASLALAQRCSGVQAPAPLFTSLLNYRHSGGDASAAPVAPGGRTLLHAEERTNYPLALAVDDLGEGFRLKAQVLADSLDPDRICALARRALEGLVEALETAPWRAMGGIDVLPAEERARVLGAWNRTEAPYAGESCVHALFEAQAGRTPDAAAVVQGGRVLRYGELNARANRLAHHLRARGVEPDTRVAICMERSPEMVVALLAVLKAGGAYVPLDPGYPPERLRWMLEDSAPALLLTTGPVAARFADAGVPLLDVADDAAWAGAPATDPERGGQRPEQLAYLIYTSGSTGRPKGAMIQHRSVCGMVAAQLRALPLRPDDRVLQFSSFSFDACVFEVFLALAQGASLHLPEEAGALAGEDLARTATLAGITHAVLPPAVLAALPRDQRLPSIHTLIMAGDAPGADLAERWSQGRRLFNAYGPTEATVWTTGHDCRPGRSAAPPIGRPVANVRVYLLDAAGQPVPQGARGELYVGGPSVGRGYWRRPALTAERFVPDPFGEGPGARLYRTGDLARWNADGELEFAGRVDQQVKVRGFRIEPGEIEARLREHPAVEEAVVVTREEEGAAAKRLVAYWVGEEVQAEALRAHLLERLPDHMVPAAYVHLPVLPLTPSGKVDRKALPAPGDDAFARKRYEAPLGATETALAEIWADVLRVERVGRHDGFFELGGHSLLAVTLIARMRGRGLHADVRTLFTAPTLAALAAAVSGESAEVRVPANRIPDASPVITPEMLPLVTLGQAEVDAVVASVPGGAANLQDVYPLAPLQEGFLFHHLATVEGDPYLLGALSRFETREALDAYLQAFGAAITRHDILRTAIAWENVPEPVQVVWRQAPLPVDEVELDPADGDVAAQLYARFDPRRHRIDIRRAPLMRCHVAREADGEGWVLLLLLHHLAGDHTTFDVLGDEIEAHLEGRADSLPRPVPFRNLVAQARLGVSPEEHRAFFTEMLGDVDAPTAPFGLLDVRGDGSGIEQARIDVEDGLGARLRERARALGVSAATLCHVAWAQVLGRASGRDDVVFGTVLFGRMQGGEGAERVMGPFLNTLPVRVRLGGVEADAGVRQTHALLVNLMRHEHASLVLAQRCSAVDGSAPLFTSLLNYRYSKRRTPAAPASGGRTSQAGERTNYPLTLSVDDLGDGFAITARAPGAVQPLRVCEMMHAALASLVGALETAPRIALDRLGVLPEAERRRVVDAWNRTETEYPADQCLHSLFERQVERTPDAEAVVYEGERLTYAELNARANRLAHHLRSLGVGPDVRVGICVERSLELVVSLLALLKAGGAYVALDPDLPDERLRTMLRDSRPPVLLTHASLAGRLAGMDVPVIAVDADASAWATLPETNPEGVGAGPDHLVYVIYTSGSTGKPKGVMNVHRNVVNRIAGIQARWRLELRESVLQNASLSFDVSAYELFWPLMMGARVVMTRPDGHRDPAYLVETIRRNDVGTASFVPSSLQLFLEQPDVERCTSLVRVPCGGEALPAALVRRLGERLPQATIYNRYGPSEAATAITGTARVEDEANGSVPIGRPMPNARAYVLDDRGEPVPAGVAGELYIGGAGVGRGYLDRPELTAERFVADPFSTEPGARLYRTGDLARWLPDGTIAFLGRTDFQVKVRGVRIEPGEIEARLLEHPGVREAVVLVREDAPGDRRLVAYVVGDEAAGADVLRAHLGQTLPEYMVPAAYVRLDAFPLTPNGKLDRSALPAPEGDAYATREYEAPRGETERALAEIWAEVLGIDRVGRQDNFFALGGHSLLVVRVIARMRQRGLHAEVRALFTAPTLAALAADLGGESTEVVVPANGIPAGCERITPEMLPLVSLEQAEIDAVTAGVEGGARNVQDIYPLAPLQEGILFHHLMTTEGDPYLLGSLSSFATRRGLDRYLGALQAVMDRHDVLRTAVVWDGVREPVQVVWREARLPVEEVQLDPADGDVGKQLYARFNPRHHRIDVRRAPLMRAHVARDAAGDRWMLLVLRHHLISDHTALEVMQSEIEAHLEGRADTLSAPVQFRNQVAQARLGVSTEEHQAFFTELLGDVEETTAPFGLLDARGDGTGMDEARQWVDDALAARLRERARALGVSAATLCHVAWAQVLARVSGRDDVVFGTLLLGRMTGGENAERMMGPFINTLPVRIRVGDVGAEASVRQTHALLTRLLRHEHAPLSLAQRCSGVEAPAPLFTALLNYRHTAGAAPGNARAAGAASAGMRRIYSEERSNYPLTLNVDDLGEAMGLTAKVREPVDAARVAAMMHTALEGLVDALATAPARAVGSIEVLPAEERARVMDEWNRTDAEYPRESCVHQLFEAQAARTPHAVAVTFGGETLMYGELNRRANRLAHHLVGLGVGPDVRVGLCMDRGMEMAVGLLAVLKAGGAYVPLDPDYPADRLRYMVQDSAPAALLAHGSLAERFAGMGVPLVAIDRDAATWADRPETNPAVRGLTPDHLVYVIYTSGSTGKPKGVMNHHGCLVNRLAWGARAWTVTADDVLLCKTSLSFDGHIRELFMPWSVGARVAMARPGGQRDPDYLLEVIRAEGVTTMNMNASMLLVLVEHPQMELCTSLRQLLVGGESLPGAGLTRLHERLPATALHITYGPSEAATSVTALHCGPAQARATVPIGRPTPNSRVYLLDPAGNPVPEGVTGELYIGGDSVCRGYLERPALTAERFVPDPFGTQPGERLYRTGDLGRWLADGMMEFLGRNDFQIKVRGFRVELGEIEARLREHPQVRESAVLARADAAGENRLIAWYTGDASVDPAALRAHLAERLPDYMVPAAFVWMERFPLTPSVKLDRKALPDPEGDAYAAREYEAPVDETEEAVAEIWAEVLRVERVGRLDDFFALGGHSLSAVRVVSRVRQELGVAVALPELFTRPVLKDFAQEILDAQLAQFDPEVLAQLVALAREPALG